MDESWEISDPRAISGQLQAAGVAGAGGAGFPSYVKWVQPERIEYLLVNHQESEPNFYADKWLGREYGEELGSFLGALYGPLFEGVLVGTKAKYRGEWTGALEAATGASVWLPADLPVPVEAESGVAFAYTPDVYTYSEETVLLMVAAGVQIGDDLPTDHGWIVHNTETLYNVYRALADGTPVTRKFVHVDGLTPRHRCLDVPLGTTAGTLLAEAGMAEGEVDEAAVLVDGGPGWCYEIERSPEEFGVRKRTNALLVLDREMASEHAQKDGQIDVLTARDWEDGHHEKEPVTVTPERVRIPLLTNAAYEGFVNPSEPIVERGDAVVTGDVIATPTADGISNTQHASIDGTVTAVTDTHVSIERS